MTSFSVVPASKQGGGHPNVTITQTFTYSNTTDSVKDAFVRLQPGLLGNPQNAGFCTQAQFQADSCPADSKVGTVTVEAIAYLIVVPTPTTSQGTVYNLKPTGGEPARLGIVVNAAEGLSKLFLQAPVYVRPGPDGYGLESTFADQPKDAGVPVQITKIALTLNGRASKGTFMRMPTSCAEGNSLSRANSWEATGTFSQKEFKMTPTGCGSLAFSAKASGSLGAPGATAKGSVVPASTTLFFNPEDAALKRAEVTLPSSVGPNLPVVLRACTRAQADASNCPASSRVGTAIIDSPLQALPVQGPVYIAFNSDASLPGLVVMLPAPVSVRLDGLVEPTTEGTRNTFASNPDLPVRSFTLQLDGGSPDGALALAKDLCDEASDRTMHVKLVAYNGKQTEFDQELATPGCDPRATVSIRRRGLKATLVARLKAAAKGPRITSFSLKLPNTLRRGKARPFVLTDGGRMRPLTRKRLASMPFPGDGVRSATVVWRGLRASRKLRRTTRIRLTLRDARAATTTLAPRVKVTGKRPKRRH
jgi:hypothetical protein